MPLLDKTVMMLDVEHSEMKPGLRWNQPYLPARVNVSQRLIMDGGPIVTAVRGKSPDRLNACPTTDANC